MSAKRPVSDGYYTIWTGWIPLVVFRANSLREARRLAASEDVLQWLRRATMTGRPLLPFGAKVWVALASREEIQTLLASNKDNFV